MDYNYNPPGQDPGQQPQQGAAPGPGVPQNPDAVQGGPPSSEPAPQQPAQNGQPPQPGDPYGPGAPRYPQDPIPNRPLSGPAPQQPPQQGAPRYGQQPPLYTPPGYVPPGAHPPSYSPSQAPPHYGQPPYGQQPYGQQPPYPPQGQGGYPPQQYPPQGAVPPQTVPAYVPQRDPYQPEDPAQYRRPLRRTANVVSGGLLLVDLVMNGLAIAMVVVLMGVLSEEVIEAQGMFLNLVVSFAAYVPGFIIPIIFIKLLLKMPARAAFPIRKFKPSLVLPAILVCLAASLLGSMISGIISTLFDMLTGVSPTMPDLDLPLGIEAKILYFFSIAIAPAILEEMLFRGLVLQGLRRYGDAFALITSSVLFSLCHGNLIQGPPTFLLGLLMGYFVLRTGSLVIGMLIHFANNFVAILPELLSLRSDEALTTFSLIMFGVYFVGGILSLIYLLVKHKHMFRLMPSHYPMREGKKHLVFYTSVVSIIYVALCIAQNALNFSW